jgi:hypothetical protein
MLHDDAMTVLEVVLGEDTEEEYKVVERTTKVVEVRLPLHVSLDGVNKLDPALRSRISLTFDGDISVLTIKE